MNIQRKLTLVVATGAVALGAGHIVQQRAAERIAAAAPVVVSAVEPLAAGPDLPVAPLDAAVPPMLVAEAAVLPAPLPALLPEPQVQPDTDTAVADTPNCGRQIDLIAQPGGMIGLTLLAPCNPSERIVLRHSGLAVTGMTGPSGAYFATIPALTATAEVQVLFGSGESVLANIAMPDVTALRRFGVQWQDVDAFQLNAFENGAGYDQPGHISAAFTGKPGDGGFLTILGDSTTDLPLLAEVYTFGTDPKAEIVIEAAVTQSTCAREILGETITMDKGVVETIDLTLAMPDCDAIGDILVLKNPDQDMTLAAAN